MRFRVSVLFLLVILVSSCARTRIKERADWGNYFAAYGIKDACFELRDNNHESIFYYNIERCGKRFTPASTFKIFNSLVGLETAVAVDDQYVIPWDKVVRRPEWDKDMNMREAFKVSNYPYYQELARRIGRQRMQHYLDTVKYGNARIGKAVDTFWLDNSLQISADEELGFVKRLYFNELPFSERSQRIVRSMMLREDVPGYKLYYKTGMGTQPDGKQIFWVVGFVERIQHVTEPKESMNKSDERNYPYFFAENFDVPANDTTKDWVTIRLKIVHDLLTDYGAIPKG